MALSTDWRSLDAGLPGDLLAGGCAIPGVYDLEPIRLSYHNEVLQIAPAEVVPWSPLHRLPARAAPLLLAVGAEETAVFLRQPAEYAPPWEGRGLRPGAVEMPGLHPFRAVEPLLARRPGLYPPGPR